jgi:protein N-terminal glutamine amidohydrolase
MPSRDRDQQPRVPWRETPWQPFFCEENVWQLLRGADLPAPAAALFVTNAARQVAMWGQRAAPADPILWDYHVVAAAGGQIFDRDDRDGVPRPVMSWLQHAFRRDVEAALRPRFRVVAAASFLATFSSDRSHMLDTNGRPLQPFPAWTMPYRSELGMTLLRFLDLQDPIAGVVVDAGSLPTAIAQLATER